MANITKRGSRYQVRIRIQGHPTRTKSFARKSDALVWARETERKIERGAALPDRDAERRTVADAVDRYLATT